MEIKDKLNKPYTEKQRLDFIVKNNHKLGYEIQETNEALLAVYREPEAPTYEEQRQARANEYARLIDPLHSQKIRKQILGTWTEDDETFYRELVVELSNEIVEKYPYPKQDESGCES